MTEPAIDLSYQARIGLAYALPKLGGGTGRDDGGSPLAVISAQNNSGSSIAVGTLVKRDTAYPSPPAIMVQAATAITDIVIGVALETIADNASGDIVIVGGPVVVLTTGTINDGSLLVPSATAGRAKALASVNEVAFAISLGATSGTSQVMALMLGLFKSFDFSSFRGAVNLVFGDGVNPLTTGQKGHLRWPMAGTLLRASLMADQVGSIVIDIWKDTWANFPPTVADTITAAAKPTLASAQKAEDTTLTGWTKTFVDGDVYAFNVDSVATVTRVTLELKYERT